ncbi:MAG: hypothetical protein VX970_01300 [Planctomycetota bacterium]|nr:hypothetical protein [Planctomycetota bacterium]MEC8338112.1 hypothetical protein [Planctomycetota bacterium]
MRFFYFLPFWGRSYAFATDCNTKIAAVEHLADDWKTDMYDA